MTNSLRLATELFYIMMAVTVVSAIARYASINHTLEGFGHAFMDLFIKVIPLYVIIGAAATILPNIGALATTLGGTITGTPVSGPSEVFAIGLKICGDILQTAAAPLALANIPVVGEAALWTAGITGGIGVIMCIIIMASFTVIAFELFFAFAQAYITLSVGAMSLGWLGSGGTKHMAESFMAGAWLSVMRLVMTVAIVGLISATMPQMMATLGTGDIKAMFMSWVQLACSGVFAALMATKVPSFATHVFSGQPAVTAPAVANGIMRSGARVASAAVGAVA